MRSLLSSLLLLAVAVLLTIRAELTHREAMRKLRESEKVERHCLELIGPQRITVSENEPRRPTETHHREAVIELQPDGSYLITRP